MGWSEEVHVSRTGQCIVQARQERRLRAKGQPVLVKPSAGPAAFLLASLAGKRHEQAKMGCALLCPPLRCMPSSILTLMIHALL